MIVYDIDLQKNKTIVSSNFDENQYQGFYNSSPLISVLKNFQSNDDITLNFSVVNILSEIYQQFNIESKNNKSFYYCANFYFTEKHVSDIVDNIKIPNTDLILLDLTWESASDRLGNLIVEKIKKKVKNKPNIKFITSNSRKDKINKSFYCDNFFEYFSYSKFKEKESINHKIENKRKKFLSLNRRPEKLKLDLIKQLYENNLIDSMHISHPEFDIFKERILDLNLNNVDQTYALENFKDNIDHRTINKGLSYLEPFMSFNEKYFEESYWNLVVEGLIENQFNAIFLTEKIFKPIYLKSPFVVFAQPFYLKSLHDMGYKSFGEFIDESYDIERSDPIRLKKIVNVIKILNNLSDESFQTMYNDLQSIVDFNYNTFMHRGKNNVIGQNLVNYLKENI